MNRIGRERGWPPSGRAEFEASCGPNGHLLIGDPDRVADRIIELHKIFKNDRILIQMAIGAMPHDELMRAIELLGTKVAPNACEGGQRMSLPHIPDPMPGDAAAADCDRDRDRAAGP